MLGRTKNSPPAERLPARTEEPIPFAPIEKRHGEEYARAAQYVFDLQTKLDHVQTENAKFRSDIQLLEGANERLHDENERIIRAGRQRELDLLAARDSLLVENASIHKTLEIISVLLVELISKRNADERQASLQAAQEAVAAILDRNKE